jgi:hypothetical protein
MNAQFTMALCTAGATQTTRATMLPKTSPPPVNQAHPASGVTYASHPIRPVRRTLR